MIHSPDDIGQISPLPTTTPKLELKSSRNGRHENLKKIKLPEQMESLGGGQRPDKVRVNLEREKPKKIF
jgi:hypothetical protein